MKLDQDEATHGEPNRPSTEPSEGGPEGEDVDGSRRSIGKDDAFHILQNARRRAVLRHILDRPDRQEFQMRDLAESVAAWEHDTTVQELTSEQRQRVYIALYQSHLPKLDNHGIIRYNQARGIVEPAALLSVFESFLTEGLDTEDDKLRIDDAGGFESARSDSSPAGLTDAISTFLAR